MKVKMQFQKADVGWLLVALVFGTTFWFLTRFPIWQLIVFGIVYFLIQGFRVEINQRFAGINSIVLLAAGSIFTAYQIQHLLLDAELRTKITGEKMLLNIICCLVIYLAVHIFSPATGVACIIAHSLLMLLGAINYFVYLFRGNEFIFADLRSIQTGLSVAENYQFTLEPRVGTVVLLSTIYIALMRRLSVTSRHHILRGILCLSLLVFAVVFVGGRTKGVVTETWEQKGSYRNGYLLNFVLSIRDNFVGEPENYNIARIQELEKRYGESSGNVSDASGKETDVSGNGTDASGKESDTSGKEPDASESGTDASGKESDTSESGTDVSGKESDTSGKEPTVIVIMSESYADLHVVGDFFTNQTVTPFYDSLTENVTKGYALSSVFGAKTPNSEWEFLTGNSMAFLPAGSVVYQQYISNEPDSLVSHMKNQGYTCVAMHPYYKTGWSRNQVYPAMGFDEMYFLEDFDNNNILRKYVKDEELYDKIIQRYESQSSKEKLFIMSISMQNHGGYTEKYDNFTEDVRMLINNFPDVNQYLSLLHESDRALEKLIRYFEQVEEPVEIVFFGDHQPSLYTGFYPYLNGKGLSGLTLEELENLYTVPFFIWTNYDSAEETVDITSLNYLSTLAMKKAGLPLSAYQQFLSDMYEVIPAVNARGYYSKLQGGYVHVEDAIGEEEEWLEDYQFLQYNNMFDKKHKSSVFFPYLE